MMLLVFLLNLYCLSTTISASASEGKPGGDDDTNEQNHKISIIVMAPSPGRLTEGWQQGPALIPAARLAVKEINNNTEILPGFTLQLIEANSGCSIVSEASISFVRDLYQSEDQVVGIVGPGCSATALQISNLTSKYEVSLLHITPSATTPQLEDVSRNTTYATISSALTFVESYLELMKHNNWTRVATLQDISRQYFQQTHSRFRSTVDSSKVVYTGSLYKGAQSVIPLGALESSGSRIVMVFAGADIAVQMLCYAYHRKMMYPNYQWIFHDRDAEQLVKNVSEFLVDGETTTFKCSKEEMEMATNGAILNLFHLIQDNMNTTLPLFNKTYNDYFEGYKEELELYRKEMKLGGKNPPNDYGNSYHDAMWALALALHNASINGVDLKSYTHNKNSDTVKIARYLKAVAFDGTSGPICFQNDTRSTLTLIDIKQFWKGKEISIGAFDRSSKERLTLFSKENKYFISDTFQEKHVKIHPVLGIFVGLLTVIVMVGTGLFQLANIIWRDHHTIKATSPSLSHPIFAGCYLFAIAVLILTVQETFTFAPNTLNSPIYYGVLCNTFTWCLILGYTLIFATIATKIWRVNRLFKHFRNKSPGACLHDTALIFIVILLLLVDVCICLTWTILDPMMTLITSSTTASSELNVRLHCTCKHITVWVSIVLAYKGILTVLLVILSIANRRIKRKNFQHTRRVNIFIYVNTTMIAIGLPLYFLLNNRSIYTSYIILCTIPLNIVAVCCLNFFLPPVLPILKLKLMLNGTSQRLMRKISSSE